MHTPSLLEAQSQGGDTAETGFDFQTNLMLCKIPLWLSFEGFDSLIREGVADFEMKFFSPTEGITREGLEAKNHHIAPKEFWDEIERFKEMDEGSPRTFGKFTICCVGISDELKPLINGLRRLRDPIPFYDEASGVVSNSYTDYLERVRKLGKNDDVAKFLYDKVLIEPFWNLLSDEQITKGIFQEQLVRHLPEYENLPGREIAKIYPCLLDLLRSHKARPITRQKLEQAINAGIGEQYRMPAKPVTITTETEELTQQEKSLQFEWAVFFGGSARQYPPSNEWNKLLIPQLDKTLKWIKENRSTRRLELKGSRRISSAIAFGYQFSAVAGFNVNMDYRGETWSTDDHPDSETLDYPISTLYREGTGDSLVVTIGIMKNQLASEVERFLEGGQTVNLPTPMLNIYSDKPVISAKQANMAVNKIKKEIQQVASKNVTKKIELFYAGPTHLALFLGHRFNTLPPIQCYEWVSNNSYVPTCYLQ